LSPEQNTQAVLYLSSQETIMFEQFRNWYYHMPWGVIWGDLIFFRGVHILYLCRK
jgi:hypothetical protein